MRLLAINLTVTSPITLIDLVVSRTEQNGLLDVFEEPA